MNRTTLITAVLLILIIVGVLALLFQEAASGPTFRAEDYDSHTECIQNIPREWRPNSLERQGAETACAYVHQRR